MPSDLRDSLANSEHTAGFGDMDLSPNHHIFFRQFLNVMQRKR